MKSSLTIGVTGELSTQVGPGKTITLGDTPSATVFSTPSMISLMEHAARAALQSHLEEGEESVGIDVNIQHTSATPPKSHVSATAQVTGIKKNVIAFEVVARDAWGEIGRGSHRRAIIKTAKFVDRLTADKATDEPPTERLPEFEHLECVVDDRLLRVRLNRPHKRNAIHAQMTGELEQLVDWLATTPSVGVAIISGAGETFCAGDDVGDLPADALAARDLSIRRGQLYERFTELPQVLIAAIDGLALGGGFVLAAACDLRVATHRARLGLPEVRLGWPPNYGLRVVSSVLGRARTLELCVLAQIIDARKAEAIGLLKRVVPQNQLEQAAVELANDLLALPPVALRAAKQQLAPGQTWSDERAADVFVECLDTDTAKLNIARFRK